MTATISGLHHVTMIAGDAQTNVDFYCGVLGLRLVKLTVNFDDPGSYHLYYGDELGRPGTILTFFSWPGAYRGQIGVGQTIAIGLSVPPASLPFWQERLKAHGVEQGDLFTRFGQPVLPFWDPDGLRLELIGAEDARSGWRVADVPAEAAIRGIHSVTLLQRDVAGTVALLTRTMQLAQTQSDDERVRYEAPTAGAGAIVDIVTESGGAPGHDGAGTIHHIAWRVPDDAAQSVWRAELVRLGHGVSPVMDRSYFHSIYFREPGGVLFEIATDSPGFTVDEAPSQLGTSLKLPPQYESSRAAIEKRLPALRLPQERPHHE